MKLPKKVGILKNLINKNKFFVIAEAGCNDEGDFETALKMVGEAAKSGAHAIKFQSFTVNNLFAVKEYTKKDGAFYLEQMNYNAKTGSLDVSGYLAIIGIDNVGDVSYNLVFDDFNYTT